jgi:Secretion system C-terminal sorting domain
MFGGSMTIFRISILVSFLLFSFIVSASAQQFLAVETADTVVYYHLSDLHIDFENSGENDRLALITTSGTELLDLSSINEITFSPSSSVDEEILNRTELPHKFSILSPYPNPFNPATCVTVQVFTETDLSIIVYNGLGQKVSVLAVGNHSQGSYIYSFNGKGLGAGIYFIQARCSDGNTHTEKIVLLK